MTSKLPLVGFERFVERDWLDKTAQWVIEDLSTKEIHARIDDYLAPYIQGETSKRKTKNVLSGAWVKRNDLNSEFKATACRLFIAANTSEKLALHYGMMVASYPFFLKLSRILGRLFRLQNTVYTQEFNRRVVEQLGDRDSIKRAAARYLQSLNQWGMTEAVNKAEIKTAKPFRLNNSELVTWLYASVLFLSESHRLTMDDIFADPAFFPFDIAHGTFNARVIPFLEVVQQGASGKLICLNA